MNCGFLLLIYSYQNMLGRTEASSKVKFRVPSQNDDQFQLLDKFQIERSIANEIMATVHRLQLPFKLDQLTEGYNSATSKT